MTTDYVLEARGLIKAFKGFTAVDNVSLNVRRGDIHALIGPNGAGKTTVFNLLTKFLSPTRGQLLFNGRDITSLSPDRIARIGMVRSFQISAVFPDLSVLENVRVALQRHRGDSFFFWRSETSLASLNGRALELLESVGLAAFAPHRAADLSYGRKRALEIATTLALEPELLLLDEPTQGMGHEDIDAVAELIRSVNRQCTVLMVEHNLKVVADLSDRITVLQRGTVLIEGDYQTVSADPQVRAAYMGVDESEDGQTSGRPAIAAGRMQEIRV
ncbi:MAG: ABC transporter ATP-binding protein [Oceanospirillaceae bacterium]|nr:ABC transporter ATP-binding protein [Oceanospirillaceae bacterium]